MSKVLFNDKKNCCACTACASICPQNAIAMVPDQDGFIYPVVDENSCIRCNLCERVCAYRNDLPEESIKEAYVAVSKCTEVQESASGGLFSALAKSVIEQNGVVYGCAMGYENGRLLPHHICVDTQADLILLKGSKYIHSDLGNTYKEVRKHLENGKIVLFSGTPCQGAGLRGYLGKNYNNLFIVDIVCHGVPSAKLFQDYIAHEEKKRNVKINSFRFRDKSQGWKLYAAMELDNGQIAYLEPEQSSYYQMFLDSYTYRENCYECPYASVHRPGDITIGDYWCVELVHPELLKENGGTIEHEIGVSCLIINNKKGHILMETFGNGVSMWSSTYENASKYNRQLISPSARKPERETVLSLAKNNYAEVEKWYWCKRYPIIFKRTIRAAIPRPVKNVLKKILHKQ